MMPKHWFMSLVLWGNGWGLMVLSANSLIWHWPAALAVALGALGAGSADISIQIRA